MIEFKGNFEEKGELILKAVCTFPLKSNKMNNM